MEPSYSTSCFLVLYAAVIFQTTLIKGNHQIALCENTKTTNISCFGESIIVINYATKPFKNHIAHGDVGVDACIFDALNSSRSHIESTCNNKHTCTVNNSLVNFTSCGSIERKINITYRCEYEYVGCFVDQRDRLLKKKTKYDRIMSAKICYEFCLPYQQSYFGTEYAGQCFCGNGKRRGTEGYKEVKNTECNYKCKEHPNEMCGGSWRISLYKTNTEIQQLKSVTTTEIKSTKCILAAALKDINLTSLQTSNDCDTFESNDTVSVNEFYIEQSTMDQSDNYNLQFLPNFVIMNFSCVSLDMIDDSATLGADGISSNTFIVIGVCSGVLVPCTVILIICFIRRRKFRKEKNPGVKFTNTEGNEHVYFNSNADMLEDKTYENSPRPPVDDSTDHIYQISAKHNKFKSRTDERLNISTHQELRHSTSSDQYADHAEGVYDRANQIQYKTKDGEQAIYSHAVEDVYDSAEVHSRPQPREVDDLYDQFSSQT